MSWERHDYEFPEHRTRQESFGQELVIENVQFEDEGKYECQGYNQESTIPVRRSFDLKVECKNIYTLIDSFVELI